MLQAIGAEDVEPLLTKLCLILGSSPEQAGQRKRIWKVGDTGVSFSITSATNNDPVLQFVVDGKEAVFFRMRQGDADGNAAGVFAITDDGKSWLAHKGILTLSTQSDANKKRTNADYFEEQGFERVDISIGGKQARWYPIACLDDSDCLDDVVGFVRYCHRLRQGHQASVALEEPSETSRQPSWVPPRDGGWKLWAEREVSDALRQLLHSKGIQAAPDRHENGLACDLLVKSPTSIIFELKKGNSPAQHYCAIGQLIAYRTFFDMPDATLVAVLEKDARYDFRPAFKKLGIELVEFVRNKDEPIQFVGLDAVLDKLPTY
jgi:hypothetical protein